MQVAPAVGARLEEREDEVVDEMRLEERRKRKAEEGRGGGGDGIEG